MRIGSLLLVTVGGATALRLLGPAALAVVQGSAPARLEDAVAAAAVVIAAALATWYLATALLGLLAGVLRLGQRAVERRASTRPGPARAVRRGSLRAVRTGAGMLESLVRRFGAPALRRGLVVGVGLGLTVGSGPALAASRDEVPADLRPGASTEQATHAADAPAGPPMNEAPDAGPPPGGSTGSATRTPGAGPSTGPPPPTAPGPGPRAPRTTPSPAPTLSAQLPPEPSPSSSPSPTSAVTPQAPPPTQLPTSTPPGPQPPPGAHHPDHRSASAQDHSATDHPTADEPAHSAPHTVAPGESLWRIAAHRLGPDASDAAIAREWPRWYAANAATIGPDPHLIHPGQELLAPPKEAGP